MKRVERDAESQVLRPESQRREVEDLEPALKIVSAEAADLRGQLKSLRDHAKRLEHILDLIKGSTSWKVTVRLRLVATKFRWLARNLNQALHTGSRVRYRIRRSLDARLIANSEYFSRDWYLGQYPDVRLAEVDPVNHYLQFGGSEGRSPSSLFDGTEYLRQNPDVQNAGINPLVHYLRYGAVEGRHATTSSQTHHFSAAGRAEKGPANPRKILVADYRIPMPDISAGEHVTFNILRDLRKIGYEVVFLPSDFAASPKYEAELVARGIQVITAAQAYSSPTEYLWLHAWEFNTFYLFRFKVAEHLLEVIRQAAPNAQVIFHAPDLYYLREYRGAEVEGKDTAGARLLRDRELAVMRRVDHIVVQSPVELSILRKELHEKSISLFPALYAPIELRPASYSVRSNIFFLGGFAHRPNLNAVQWFVSEVWHLVHQQLPEAEFHIVGAEIPPSVLKLRNVPGVKVLGFISDLRPLMATMRVGVAPLLFGAGIKGKVAMTMGAGIPCVCTDIAAEGMHLSNRVHALIANEPHEFADAVVTLYRDEVLWNRLSQNGQTLVEQLFSAAANRASLLATMDAARGLPISLFIDYCRTLVPRPISSHNQQAEVDVSVIVPVCNNWDLTRACLNSILETTLSNNICFELILADDGSSDETVQAAQLYPGLKVVRTEINVGFACNCNNAARYARGRYVLFLNNNTVVLPGWLFHLFRTLEDDDNVAIAFSKLLYPDGLIQEAGAVLFNDRTALNNRRGYGRYTPVFNIERETDYVSGASILVRRSFWDAIGGFNERFKLAYCEDCDLAMTARSRGLRVVYEAASKAVHCSASALMRQDGWVEEGRISGSS